MNQAKAHPPGKPGFTERVRISISMLMTKTGFALSITVLSMVSFSLLPTLSAQEPIRQASEARLWLKVPAGHPPLVGVEVSTGNAAPVAWEKDPAARARQIEITVPVRWWDWAEIDVRFTPAHDGPLELILKGPWAAEESNGKMPRQEILWDAITAEGTEILNGSFESQTDGNPESWLSPWGPYPSADAWPLLKAVALEGKSVAASWCKRPLHQSLQVRKGVPVSLRLHAKSATPPDFIAPKRLGNDSPAHQALRQIQRGVNLGNGWEAPPPHGWGIRFTTEDIDHIADEGFDHIRVPVAWHFHLSPSADALAISPALLAELEPVLRRALDRNLRVLLNWHHFHDFTDDPARHLPRFIAGWETIANHFQDWPPELFFELLNEPCDALTTEVANPIYQKTIASIRRSNPERLIFVSPGNWGIARELDRLILPNDDDRIAVTIHCYDPFHFTHQGASWVGLQDLRGIRYPGPPETPLEVPPSLSGNHDVVAFIQGYNTRTGDSNPSSARIMREELDTAWKWSRHFGRPIHLGEFGAYKPADHASRLRYLRDVRTHAETRGIPWALWEWKSGFGYWDPAINQARFRQSLFE